MPPAPDDRSGSTRRDPMILMIVAVALLVGRVVYGIVEPPLGKPSPIQMQGSFRTSRSGTTSTPSPDAGPVADRVEWRDVDTGAAESMASGKPILFDFTAEWCPPCRLLNREVFADAASAGYINEHFIPVRVLDRQREEGKNPPQVDALQRRYAITGFPTLIVQHPEGAKPVVLDGYGGRQQTMAALMAAVNPQ